MKNRISAGLLGFLLLVSLCGCSISGGGKDEADRAREARKEMDAKNPALVTVGSERISPEEAGVYWMILKDRYESAFGPEVWNLKTGEDKSFLSDAFSEMMEEMVQIHILCQKAEELQITVDPESVKELEESVEKYLAGLPTEDIERFSLDKDTVYKVFHQCLLAETVFENVTSSVSVSIPDAQIRQCRVYAMTYKNGETDLRNKLDKARKELAEITDDEERKLYFTGNSKDDKVEYVLGADSMDVEEEFLRQALKLKTGEYSENFKTEIGTTFLYCVNASDEEAIRQKKYELIQASQKEVFAGQYEEWKKDISVKTDEAQIQAFWDKIAE